MAAAKLPLLPRQLAAFRLRSAAWILTFALMFAITLALAGCRQPAETTGGASLSSNDTSIVSSVANVNGSQTVAVAIASLSTRDLGRTVRIAGTLRSIQRYSSGHALIALADASGELPVYIRKETGIDLLGLTVGEAYEIDGRLQSFEGGIELVPAASSDVRLTDGYDFEAAQVVSVVDGDTVHIRRQTGETATLRIIGVDTPEKAMDGQPAEFYAAEATAFAERTLKGKTVFLERDNSETDRYGRLLRYIWLAEPTAITPETIARGNFSALLLQGGYGEFIDVGSDDKYLSVFEPWERQAQQAGKGMWAKR